MSSTSDVIVLGAGIVGSAIAFRLAERGATVRVLEASEAPATGSTGRSAAGVRVQFSSEWNVRLSLAGIEEYRSFPERFGHPSGYRPQGYLFLVPEAAWESHAQGLALQRSLGAPVEELSPEDAQRWVSFNADGIHRTTYGPIDGVVDPHALTMGYLAMAKERGTTLHLSCPLIEASCQEGVWNVKTASGTFEAPVVINATGAWAGEVAGRAGLSLPVTPSRRMVFVTDPRPGDHAYPLTIDLSSGVYLRSEGERILLGRSNPHEVPGFVEGVDWDWLEPTLELALPRFPFLADAGLDRRASWWGYYEVTPDHDAILGRHPEAEGWVDAAGFSGHGVQHAAMVGRLMAEEVIDGAAHSMDIAPLRHARFLDGDAFKSTERNIV